MEVAAERLEAAGGVALRDGATALVVVRAGTSGRTVVFAKMGVFSAAGMAVAAELPVAALLAALPAGAVASLAEVAESCFEVSARAGFLAAALASVLLLSGEPGMIEAILFFSMRI